MKNLTKILLGAVAVSAIATSAFAQEGDSDTASVGITVIRPVSITGPATAADGLQFGKVVAGAGEVTISTSGDRTLANGATFGLGTAAEYGQAVFTVKAEGGQALNWVIDDTVSLTGPAGSTALSVTIVDDAPTTATGTIGSETTYTVNVGGKVTVAASAVAGAYTGTLNFKVDYQ